MWGKANFSTSYDVVLSDKSIAKQSLPDPTSTYKFAFIIVASKRNLISDDHVQRIDIIRRYWDDAFEKVTLAANIQTVGFHKLTRLL